MTYCSNCGTKVVLKVPEGDSIPRYVCENCHTIHYRNPKMVVGCIPVWQGKILICKRAIDPAYGKWTVPAGFLENGETVEQGALRETVEEAGIDVELDGLHAVYSIPHVNQVYLVFRARMLNESFKPGEETLECRFCDPSEIPWEEIAFTSIRFSLKTYVENLDNPNGGPYMGYLDKRKIK